MNIDNSRIGANAGIVWNILHSNPIIFQELMLKTGLSGIDLACAIGWLARENKITFDKHDDNLLIGLSFCETYY